MEHNYGEPQLPADGPLREYPEKTWSGRCYGVYRRHKVAFIAAAIGTILCMFFLIYVLAVAMRKKKVIRKQKEKQMRTYKEVHKNWCICTWFTKKKFNHLWIDTHRKLSLREVIEKILHIGLSFVLKIKQMSINEFNALYHIDNGICVCRTWHSTISCMTRWCCLPTMMLKKRSHWTNWTQSQLHKAVIEYFTVLSVNAMCPSKFMQFRS